MSVEVRRVFAGLVTTTACFLILTNCGHIEGPAIDPTIDGGAGGQAGGGSGGATAGGGAAGGGATGDAGCSAPNDPGCQVPVDAAGGGGGGPPDAMPPGSDRVAPGILSLSPSDKQTGVAADATIVIRFTEPMDAEKTEAAYQSADLPADQVTFSWNDVGDVLTIKPRMALPYAEGTTATVPAKTFVIVLTTNAQDRAGNPLATLLSFSFQTARRINLSLPFVASMSGDASVDLAYPSTGIALYVGSDFGSPYRAFITFDMSPLEGALSVEKAEISLYQQAVTGFPYARLGGKINLDRVSFESFDETTIYTTMTIGSLGVLSDKATIGAKTVTVTAAVQDDWAKRQTRGKRSQYRLSFPTMTSPMDDTDVVEISDAAPHLPRLTVTAVVP